VDGHDRRRTGSHHDPNCGGGDSSHRITFQPPALPPHFEMPITFTNALVPGARTVLGIAPANTRRVTVKGWTIDVIADGAGSGHLIEVGP
jgi:hypothetical protein